MAGKAKFTLWGEAAGAYCRMQEGVPPENDSERALRIATMVTVFMGKGMDQSVAVALILKLARDGLVAASDRCIGEPKLKEVSSSKEA